MQAAQDISFDAMSRKMRRYVDIGMKDPNVATMIGFCGGTTAMNQGRMFITLKPLGERKLSADQVIRELSKKFAEVPGATLYMQAQQDLQIGGRLSQAQYQYTLQGEDLNELNTWAPQLLQKMRALPQLQQVNTDQQDKGLEANVIIDRDTASRLGVAAADIDTVLYDAFGQRQVSTIYQPLNQYHVVMEVAPQFQQSPDTLQSVYVHSSNGNMVPLSAFAHFGPANTSLAVSHQGQWPAVTISFNLAPGVSLGQATTAIEKAERSISFPGDHSRQLPGNGSSVPGFAGQRTGPDHDGAAGGLHRAGNSLRELHSSHHDSFDDSFGGCGRSAGAEADAQRTQRDRTDRHHSADRPGEEERHHDDRLRAGGGAARRQSRRSTRFTKPACCASVPS